MNDKALASYIQKVVEDSCKAEKRECDVQYEYMVIHGYLIFAIKTKYIRVRRRINYRLLKNLKKNFGLTFNLVYPDAVKEGNDYLEETLFDIIDCVDPNYSLKEIEVFGKKYTLRSYLILQSTGEDNALRHLNALKEHGFDHEDPSHGWDKFLKAYQEVYHETPEETFEKRFAEDQKNWHE